MMSVKMYKMMKKYLEAYFRMFIGQNCNEASSIIFFKKGESHRRLNNLKKKVMEK
jgi:hypothetical protein